MSRIWQIHSIVTIVSVLWVMTLKWEQSLYCSLILGNAWLLVFAFYQLQKEKGVRRYFLWLVILLLAVIISSFIVQLVIHGLKIVFPQEESFIAGLFTLATLEGSFLPIINFFLLIKQAISRTVVSRNKF